jgi:hypothetical protein
MYRKQQRDRKEEEIKKGRKNFKSMLKLNEIEGN